MDEEQKLFSYMELKAMCMLCAAKGLMIGLSPELIDPIEGRKEIEDEVEKTIKIRWDHTSKQ